MTSLNVPSLNRPKYNFSPTHIKPFSTTADETTPIPLILNLSSILKFQSLSTFVLTIYVNISSSLCVLYNTQQSTK